MADERVVAPDAPELPEEEPARGWKALPYRGLLEWVAIIVGAVLVAFLVKTFLFQAFYIPSASMSPTLKVSDRVLVNKLSYDLHDVNRGDIVVFRTPPGGGDGTIKDLIKRVVGLPGDTVEAHDGRVFVNGKPLDEPYTHGASTSPFAAQKIPPGHYWMMGDNRPNSRDSRFFGAVNGDLIVGRAFIRVWPIGSIGFL
jgi:signal peptidase I